MTDWTYFPREALAPHLRRRKPIGRRAAAESELGQMLSGLTQSQFSTDILLTLASRELAWLTDGAVACNSWTGVKLTNDGGYLVPSHPAVIRVYRSDRQFDETLSADGAGLCATLFLIQNVQNREVPWSRDRRKVFKQLYSFLDLHPEVRAIRNVLD